MSQEPPHTPDQWTEGPECFIYRDGNWTTPSGYCLSTARGHELTMKFYELHGRVPFSPPPVKLLTTRRSKPVAPKAPAAPAPNRSAAVKAAIARAVAAKTVGGATLPSPVKSTTRGRSTRARVTPTRPASAVARRQRAAE